MQTERLESMSQRGFLRIFRQDDGDIIITIGEDNGRGGWNFASVEFCTAGPGGGGSKRTHAALIDLMTAMAADNLDEFQLNRRPLGLDAEEQRLIVAYGEQVKQARAERDSWKAERDASLDGPR